MRAQQEGRPAPGIGVGGVLLLLPASQLLIDHVGWREAYQWFGVIVLCLVVPLMLLPWRLFASGSPHVVQKAQVEVVEGGWTLGSAMRHHAFWALFSTFFFTAIGMYAISAQACSFSGVGSERISANSRCIPSALNVFLAAKS